MFNQKYIYETKIKDIIEQLTIICNDNQIPMFITMALEDDGKKTEYKSKMLDPDFLGVSLVDDKFKDHLNVMNGFTTVYPQENRFEINF